MGPVEDGEHRIQQTWVRDELRRICSSAAFAKSPALARLLTFLVERDLAGEGDNLRETFIGVEFFRRSPTYDPKIDSVVRVNATRLRSRLDEHYAASESPTGRIVLRKGSYVPSYEQSADPTPAPPPSSDFQSNAALLHAAPLPSTATGASSRPWSSIGLGVLGLILLSALLHELWKTPTAQAWTTRPFARFGGSQQFADFSPDGRTLVFVSSDLRSTRRNVYVQDISTNTAHRLTNDPEDESRPVWSPDGKQIAFLKVAAGGTRDVMTLDVRTGAETRVASLHGSSPWLCQIARITWTADGKTLISSGATGENSVCGLVAIDIAAKTVRPLSQPPIGSLGDLEAAVSPEGKSVAFLRNTSFAVGDIYLMGLDGQGLKRLTHDERDIVGFCWSPDGKSLILTSDRTDGQIRLWKVAVSGGEPRALTDGYVSAFFPAISPSAQQLAFTQFQRVSDIWKQTAKGVTQLTQNQGFNGIPSISPDGKRLVYDSTRTGSAALWVSDADGQNPSMLIKGDEKMTPNGASWSPDGKRLLFECRSSGISNICVTDALGGRYQKLTDSSFDHILPVWSHDGRQMYYASNKTGRYEIYRQDVAVGPAVQLTQRGGQKSVVSTDGKTLFVHRGGAGGIVAIPTTALDEPNGSQRIEEAERSVFLTSELGHAKMTDWQPVGSQILFLGEKDEHGLSPILGFRLSDGHIGQAMAIDALFAMDPINLAVSPEGASLYSVKEKSSTEISLMQSSSR